MKFSPTLTFSTFSFPLNATILLTPEAIKTGGSLRVKTIHGGRLFVATQSKRIGVAEHVVYFPRAHEELLAQAFHFKQDPFKGDVIMFVG